MTPQTLVKTGEPSTAIDRSDWSAHYNCEHVPNAETIAAFEETEEIIRRIRAGEYVRTYANHAELVAEILLEMQNEDEA